jgi:hypothetical protein
LGKSVLTRKRAETPSVPASPLIAEDQAARLSALEDEFA